MNEHPCSLFLTVILPLWSFITSEAKLSPRPYPFTLWTFPEGSLKNFSKISLLVLCRDSRSVVNNLYLPSSVCCTISLKCPLQRRIEAHQRQNAVVGHIFGGNEPRQFAPHEFRQALRMLFTDGAQSAIVSKIGAQIADADLLTQQSCQAPAAPAPGSADWESVPRPPSDDPWPDCPPDAAPPWRPISSCILLLTSSVICVVTTVGKIHHGIAGKLRPLFIRFLDP